MNSDDKLQYALIAFGFALGVLATSIIGAVIYADYYKVTKLNIGEFIIRDGKMFSVYEIERNKQGDMQAGVMR